MHILSLTVNTTLNFRPHGEPNLIIFSCFPLYSKYLYSCTKRLFVHYIESITMYQETRDQIPKPNGELKLFDFKSLKGLIKITQ